MFVGEGFEWKLKFAGVVKSLKTGDVTRFSALSKGRFISHDIPQELIDAFPDDLLDHGHLFPYDQVGLPQELCMGASPADPGLEAFIALLDLIRRWSYLCPGRSQLQIQTS